MNRKFIIFILLLSFCKYTYAQIQEGYVRTAGSEDKQATPVDNVTIRPIGGNSVLSDENGYFSLELDRDLKEGEYFYISTIHKKGYEPLDKKLLSRKFVYSASVPIEIVLISSKELAKKKAKIEERARKKADEKCKLRIKELRKQLKKKKITIDECEKSISLLNKEIDVFESLIDAMAEHYARTDYEHLDSINKLINTYIINGELEKADSLINSKGDIIQRANENISKGEELNEIKTLLNNVSNRN